MFVILIVIYPILALSIGLMTLFIADVWSLTLVYIQMHPQWGIHCRMSTELALVNTFLERGQDIGAVFLTLPRLLTVFHINNAWASTKVLFYGYTITRAIVW